jgi:hypothetical protein
MRRLTLLLLLLLLSLIQAAHARVTRTKVLLRGLDRDLVITLGEPGLPDLLVLDGNEFEIDGVDGQGGLTATRYIQVGARQEIETVTLLRDPLILNAFKRAPYWTAMSMAFQNPGEVACPPGTNAVLMYNQARTPRWVIGNCLDPSQEG